VLAARWIGLGVEAGALFALSVSTLSILGYDHNKDEPVLKLWNDSGHVTD
jgi:probable phosphoglycerate mutase